MIKLIQAAMLFLAASFVFGQAEVEERTVTQNYDVTNTTLTSNVNKTNGPSAASVAELYFQLQTLQQEVLTLRGLVEEQSFQIKKLKQQRLDDYVDLDRRVSQLGNQDSSGLSNNSAAQATNASGANTVNINLPPKEDEFKRYKEAYKLATQDTVKAEEALKSFIQDYPDSRYVANGLFVLGEIKLKLGELEDARAWFMRVLIEHPDHYRVPNAKLKLGTVHQMMGDMAQAKKFWQEVANANNSVSDKAKEQLTTHFPDET